MLRSLPSRSRFLPAILLTLITTVIVYRFIFPAGRHSYHLTNDSQCSPLDGNCDTGENLIKSPSRQEFDSLQHTIESLREDIEKLKTQEPPKVLTPEEQLWDSRRTECGDGVLRNIDYQHSVMHEKFWATASKSFWDGETKKWKDYVASLDAYPSNRFKGRGIVMLGGNGQTLDLIMITLRMLRELNCKLPVEVWHLPGELKTADVQALEGLGATPRDFGGKDVLVPMKEIKGRQKNFQIKVAAWVNSAFEEIIGLDSDVMPVRDPSYLFETEVYKRTGQIFWPDWWKTHRSNPVWDLFETPCKDEWEQESGEVVYNKRQNWEALMLANYFSQNSDLYFQLLNGDKDLLRFAHKALRKEYFMSRFPTAGGAVFESRFCGFAFIQWDPSDRVIFVHANLLKEMPRTEFFPEHDQGVFRVFKDYTLVNQNTWLRPRMETSQHTHRPCMELFSGEGEPDIRERPFEELPGLEGFNAFYQRNGGVGGGINDRGTFQPPHRKVSPFEHLGEAGIIVPLETKKNET